MERSNAPAPELPAYCGELVTTIGGVPVYRAGRALCWRSGMAIDADGAPRAYAPLERKDLRPLDLLANAGKPGRWWGLACDKNGEPYVQGPADLAPGYYVSPTALVDRMFPERDPRRYVDSTQVPYIAIPPELRALPGEDAVRLGDLVVAYHGARRSAAIVADIGPKRRLGEGSIALAQALGIPSSPRNGGVAGGVTFYVWPGSRRPKPWSRALDSITAQVAELERDLEV